MGFFGGFTLVGAVLFFGHDVSYSVLGIMIRQCKGSKKKTSSKHSLRIPWEIAGRLSGMALQDI